VIELPGVAILRLLYCSLLKVIKSEAWWCVASNLNYLGELQFEVRLGKVSLSQKQKDWEAEFKW
jgi:hypothetical protein